MRFCHSERPPTARPTAILRSAERNPWEVYKSIFGLPDDMSSSLLEQQIAAQRKSVNDLLREQLEALTNNRSLSRQDLIRLELHQDSIRDLEVRMMECHMPQPTLGRDSKCRR